MKIVTADIDQAASAAITTLVEGPAGSFYRRVFNMRFQTGGTPDGIRIQTDTTAFAAEFSSEVYNLLDDESPVRAVDSKQEDAHTVVFHLDRPWKITRVSIKTDNGDMLAFTEDAVVSDADMHWACAAGPEVHVIEAKDVGMQKKKQLRQTADIRVQLCRLDGEAIAEEPTVTVLNGATIAAEFISQAFAVKTINAGNEPISLDLTDILSIEIESLPTGPRIGLAAEGEGESSGAQAYFWQVPGEINNAAPYAAQNEKAGEAFAGALQRYVDDYLDQRATAAKKADVPYTVPDHLDLSLVVESDAPCRSEIEITFDYFLVRNTFPTDEGTQRSEEKQVLRFEGQPSQDRRVTVRLPQNGTLSSGILEVDASFGSPPSVPVGGGVPPIRNASDTGVHLGMERWAAQPIVLTEALTLAEMAVGVVGLESGTQLAVSLRADNNGLIDGQALAQQQVTLSTVGKRHYLRIPLGEVVPLTDQNYWILVKALSGAAVWLTSADAQSRIILSETTASGGVSSNRTELKGIRSFYALFSRSSQACRDRTPLSLALGNSTVSFTPSDNGRLKADDEALKNSLNDCIAAPTPDCILTPEGIEIPLQFTASVKGLVTVYPPELQYELPKQAGD